MAEIPTPDLAVPYAAPKQVNTMADVQPIAPKNGYIITSASKVFEGCHRKFAQAGRANSSQAPGRRGVHKNSRHRRGCMRRIVSKLIPYTDEGRP